MSMVLYGVGMKTKKRIKLYRLLSVPSDLIMAISGHKSEKAFKKYIKADTIKKASMIKKLWDEQPSL